MENFFLNRYRKKSAAELRSIVDNKEQFQTEAVNAAIQLLEEGHDIEPVQSPPPKEKSPKKQPDFGSLNASFDTSSYLKDFSWKDFLTALTLALFFNACNEILGYYSNEEFVEGLSGWIRWSGFFLIFYSNHIIYRIEHNRSNNFIGRSMHDLMFIALLFLIRWSYSSILDPSYSFTIDSNDTGLFFILFGIVISVISVELFLAVLKSILKLFRWQIF